MQSSLLAVLQCLIVIPNDCSTSLLWVTLLYFKLCWSIDVGFVFYFLNLMVYKIKGAELHKISRYKMNIQPYHDRCTANVWRQKSKDDNQKILWSKQVLCFCYGESHLKMTSPFKSYRCTGCYLQL